MSSMKLGNDVNIFLQSFTVIGFEHFKTSNQKTHSNPMIIMRFNKNWLSITKTI